MEMLDSEMTYKDKYLPVEDDFEASVLEKIESNEINKIHYFGPNKEVLMAHGSISSMEKKSNGYFALLGNVSVRLDKIITLFGTPGPAYADYELYANACLACEDMGQFS